MDMERVVVPLMEKVSLKLAVLEGDLIKVSVALGPNFALLSLVNECVADFCSWDIVSLPVSVVV